MKFADLSTNVIQHSNSTIASEKMVIDQESADFLLRSVTEGLYQDPYRAMAREYISNGVDATIERMGAESAFGDVILDKAVEVSLPTKLNNQFVIRDFGTGMTRDVLLNVFPKYAASTKRQSNAMIGGFGLGAKSALAATSQFVVTTVRDGKQNTLVIRKGADGTGEFLPMDEIDTDEENGTTVTINIDDVTRLLRLFRESDLLLGFPRGSILIDGQMHDNSVYNTDLYTPVDGNIGWMKSNFENSGWKVEQTIVVGPISYKVDPETYLDYDVVQATRGIIRNTILNLPIGSAELTSARDGLIMSPLTLTSLRTAHKSMVENFPTALAARIDVLATREEAFTFAQSLYSVFGKETAFTYKGDTIPTAEQQLAADTDDDGRFLNFVNASGGRYTRTKVADTHRRIVADSKAILVHSVTNATESNRVRRAYETNTNSDFSERTQVVFTNLDLTEDKVIGPWITSFFGKVMTADEWFAQGVAYRKENAAEYRRNNAAAYVPKDRVERIKGSAMVSLLDAYSNGFETGIPAVRVFSDTDVPVYVAARDASGTLSNTIAEDFRSLAPSQIATLRVVKILGEQLFKAQDKTMKIVRLHSNAKMEPFLEAYPNAISLDTLIAQILADTTLIEGVARQNALADLRSEHSQFFSIWGEGIAKRVENTEFVEFMNEVADAQSDVRRYSDYTNLNGLEAIFTQTVTVKMEYTIPSLFSRVNAWRLEKQDKKELAMLINALNPVTDK